MANYRDMFESRIAVGAKEKLLIRASGKPDAETDLLGPMTWKVTQRNAWKGIANLRTEQLNRKTKSQLHALTTINLKKK